jgi:hypothetical protein
MKKQTTIASREVETTTSLVHQEKMTKRFLRGPIPLIDLALAKKIGGYALTVLVLIHHRVALTKSPSVTLPARLLAEFGISRDTKARALHALQEASLIAVDRHPGKTARVTLLPNSKSGLGDLFSNPPTTSAE